MAVSARTVSSVERPSPAIDDSRLSQSLVR